MARVHSPQFGQDYSPEPRRVVSVGELERIYGRNAQIELRAPAEGGADATYDAAYADTVELPMRRNPWLWVVLLLLVGALGVVTYALYRNGYGAVLARKFGGVPVLHETDSPPAQPSYVPPTMLVRVSAAGSPALGRAASVQSELGEPTATSTTESSVTAQDVSAGAATRSTPEDEAATREALRLEAERVQREQRSGPLPQREQEPVPPSNPSPPGYIEAEIR